MERLIMKEKLPYNAACSRIFGFRYAEITEAIMDFWNLPDGMKRLLLEIDSSTDLPARIVSLAGAIADMLFGNIPAGAEPMGAAEKKMRDILKVEDFTMVRFLEFTAIGSEPGHVFQSEPAGGGDG
jgi:hypothetical protein